MRIVTGGAVRKLKTKQSKSNITIPAKHRIPLTRSRPMAAAMHHYDCKRKPFCIDFGTQKHGPEVATLPCFSLSTPAFFAGDLCMVLSSLILFVIERVSQKHRLGRILKKLVFINNV